MTRITAQGIKRSHEEAERLRDRLLAEGWEAEIVVRRTGQRACTAWVKPRPEEEHEGPQC